MVPSWYWAATLAELLGNRPGGGGVIMDVSGGTHGVADGSGGDESVAFALPVAIGGLEGATDDETDIVVAGAGPLRSAQDAAAITKALSAIRTGN